MKKILVIGAVLLAAGVLCFYSMIPPTPDRAQILQAVITSNNQVEEPLDLVYEEMQVPHRLPGRALVVVWVPDKSIQRNYVILYNEGQRRDKGTGALSLCLVSDIIAQRGVNYAKVCT